MKTTEFVCLNNYLPDDILLDEVEVEFDFHYEGGVMILDDYEIPEENEYLADYIEKAINDQDDEICDRIEQTLKDQYQDTVSHAMHYDCPGWW